ncbi:MAG: hypothetical protein PHO66_00760 [Eubacteriales bacterium]|nr:hypothetical protein [Eubacteriales bacterium]
MTRRENIEKIFEGSRKQLLALVGFSAANLLLGLFNANITFLFSASFPQFVLELGKILWQDFGSPTPFLIALVLSLALIALYGICYLLAKKRRAFMAAALALFTLDTLFLLWTLMQGFDWSALFDIGFHVWVMFFLIMGTKAWLDLRSLPADEPESTETV